MSAARLSFVVFVALLLQTTLVCRIEIMGARPDVMLLVAIAAGFEGGSDRGAIVGFAAGLCLDLFLNTPLGLSALTYCIVGYLVGTLHHSFIRTTWWIPVLFSAAASAAGVVLYFLAGSVLGDLTLSGTTLPAIVAVVAVFNALLSRPAMRFMRWANAEARGDRLSFR